MIRLLLAFAIAASAARAVSAQELNRLQPAITIVGGQVVFEDTTRRQP